jgi:hypothetical protein
MRQADSSLGFPMERISGSVSLGDPALADRRLRSKGPGLRLWKAYDGQQNTQAT